MFGDQYPQTSSSEHMIFSEVATTDSSFYFLLASASYTLMCLSLIPEGPLEQ